MTDFGEYPAMVAALEDAIANNPLREQPRQRLHPIFDDPGWYGGADQERVDASTFTDRDWAELAIRQRGFAESEEAEEASWDRAFASMAKDPLRQVVYPSEVGTRGRRIAGWD